jgi:hypothetical protein
MYDVISIFTASPTGCVDWCQISAQVTNSRIPPFDLEYAAHEFIPHIHYRPSIGMVVMEKTSRGNTDFQRYKQTLKRIKQGVPLIVRRFKEMTQTVTPPPSPQRLNPIDSFVSSLSPDLLADLKTKSATAIARFERGDNPTFAMAKPMDEAEAIAMGLTATGRPKRRYETKAIRMAKEAARSAGVLPAETTQVKSEPAPPPAPTFQLPPFFHQIAQHFTERS